MEWCCGSLIQKRTLCWRYLLWPIELLGNGEKIVEAFLYRMILRKYFLPKFLWTSFHWKKTRFKKLVHLIIVSVCMSLLQGHGISLWPRKNLSVSDRNTGMSNWAKLVFKRNNNRLWIKLWSHGNMSANQACSPGSCSQWIFFSKITAKDVLTNKFYFSM